MSALKNICSNFVVILLLIFCNVLEAQSITELEYFFGNDPGTGNGTLVTATANSGDLTQSMVIPLTGLSSGFHTLTCRVKDDTNTWSLYHKKTFYIIDPVINEVPSNLAAAEYWFGADPGHGNGTVLAIPGAPSETIENFAIPLSDLEAGFHTLSIRIKNVDDMWSLYHRKTFYIIGDEVNDAPSNLAAVEYWFGVDPGNGNGTAIPITGSPSETIENFAIPLGDLEAGFQTLSIRIKNLDDTWSLFHRKTFYIISPENSDLASPLTDAEFLYDAELGFGTGTAVAITPTGNPNEYLVEIPTDMETCGLHDISLSVKNALGNYSLYDITTDTDVYDNVPPTIVVFPNITVQLDANGQAPPFTIANVDNGTFDDCELASVTLNETQFDYTCADLGINTVEVTATDAEDKVSTLNVAVMVEDNINPVAISQDITIQLDASGNASTTADAIDNNSTDNCSIMNKSIDVSSFTCEDLGMNTVNLTVTDQSGNQNTTTAIVTVEDNIDPVVSANDLIVQLDVHGNATLTTADVDDNSTDNCSVTNKSLDITSFTCANLGMNTVTLTAIDQSGNQSTTTAIITVEDNIDPVASAQNITVQLDANGNATITVDAIDDNSTDNCGVDSMSVDISSFTCADAGMNTVALTVFDQSGNQNTTNAIVTVEDNINPIAIGQDIIIDLDGNTSVSIVPEDVDNGSNDNCGEITLSIDVDTFTSIGEFPVVLTATDSYGNTHSVTVIVTVTDALSIEEFDSDSVNIFPNPTKNILHVNFERVSEYLFSIYDISGKEILFDQKLKMSNTIDFYKYESGMYLLIIKDKTNNTSQNFKIIKL